MEVPGMPHDFTECSLHGVLGVGGIIEQTSRHPKGGVRVQSEELAECGTIIVL